MKRLLALLIAIALTCCLFTGCQIHTDDGVTRITLDLNWAEIGKALGDAIDEIGKTVEDRTDDASATEPTDDTNATTPTLDIPEIPEGSDFQVHYIDVGQADCALIICDDEYMLIDGGNDADGDLVVSYLTNLGVTELDLVVATHAHEDHLGGLDHIVDAFTVEEVWYPEYRHGSVNEKMFIEAVKRQGVTTYQPDPGTTYTLGSAICQVVGPITMDVEDPNDTSIVIKVVYGETSFLFTGDAELAEETSILDAGYDISCDVLKVGHHGAYTSTGYRWLKAAAPTYAVISVGTGNSYGHPTEGTLSRLHDAEVTVYRTDLQGHIVCVSDGTNITFSVQKNPNADTFVAP